MTDVIPVPIWPWPMSPEREALLRSAKAALDIQQKMLPCPSVPGAPGRVLAWGEVPPHFCESVLIAPENVESEESVRKALSFLLTAPKGAPGSFSGEAWLSAVLGCKVRFLYEEPYPAPADTPSDVGVVFR